MHRRFLKTTALVTALSLLLTSFALADVIGELIQGHDTYLGAGMELSKGVYWTGSDYETENYIEYTPSTSVFPVVVSGSKVCNYGSYSSMASLLEKEGKHVIAGINGDYFVVKTSERKLYYVVGDSNHAEPYPLRQARFKPLLLSKVSEGSRWKRAALNAQLRARAD